VLCSRPSSPPTREKTYAAAWSDGATRIFDVATGKPQLVLLDRARAVHVAYARDGDLLISCGDDGTARIWDAHAGTLIGELHHAAMAASISASPDLLATASSDGAVRLWHFAPLTAPWSAIDDETRCRIPFHLVDSRLVPGSPAGCGAHRRDAPLGNRCRRGGDSLHPRQLNPLRVAPDGPCRLVPAPCRGAAVVSEQDCWS
jgi:hypothetical protein